MDRLEQLKVEYRPYASTVAWLTVLSVFVPMAVVYWETCSGRFFILLSTVVSLWVVEIVPLWVTALSIPVQVIFLRVMAGEDGQPLNGKQATKLLFEGMFGSVPLTLLAAFCLAEALKTHGPLQFVSKRLVNKVASLSWPLLVLLTMFLVLILSPLIGNIPAVEVALSILKQQTESLPSDSVYSRTLYCGIMVAGSLGGMTSPIAAAHSIFAFDYSGRTGYSSVITWGTWIASTVPIAFITSTISFAIICAYFLLNREEDPRPKVTESPILLASLDERSGARLGIILSLYAVTFILWVLTGYYSEWIGELGIASLIPIVILFGSEILSPSQLSNLPWHIILLAIGGSALSIAAQHSGYLQHISSRYINNLHWSLFVLAPTFFGLYKSQFVTSLLFIPAVVASNADAEMTSREGAIRFMLTFMGCSLGMGLPISSMTGMMLEEARDVKGIRRLRTRDFVAFGLTSTLSGFLVTLAIGRPILEKLIK